jgi:tagatose-1,6-bisphosphate aldolase
MKVILDIKDDKAEFVLELLRNLKFVKTQPITPYAAAVLKDLKEAVEEVNELKKGKKKGKSLSAFLDEV